MKEVLFRGKIVDTNEWIQGSLVRAIDCFDEDEKFFIIPEDAIYYHYGEFDVVKEVRRETVGQYTGLTDKNGKKIFEGDILKGCWKMIFEVYYDDCLLQFRVKTIDGFNKDIDYYGYPHQIEVIGNIYDNKELLK